MYFKVYRVFNFWDRMGYGSENILEEAALYILSHPRFSFLFLGLSPILFFPMQFTDIQLWVVQVWLLKSEFFTHRALYVTGPIFCQAAQNFWETELNLTCFTVSQQCPQSLIHKEQPCESEHENRSGYFFPDTRETPWTQGTFRQGITGYLTLKKF